MAATCEPLGKVIVAVPSPTFLIILASRAATLAANNETASKPAERVDSSYSKCLMVVIFLEVGEIAQGN